MGLGTLGRHGYILATWLQRASYLQAYSWASAIFKVTPLIWRGLRLKQSKNGVFLVSSWSNMAPSCNLELEVRLQNTAWQWASGFCQGLTLGAPQGGWGQRVQISSFCLPLLIGTLGSQPPGGPPSVPSPILLTNNDSYRQNSALYIFTCDLDCF